MTTELTIRSQVAILPKRQWKDEPDGPNDRPVEIWYNNNWVPAFFSDVKKGDFYLWSGVDLLEPGKCFFANSDCVPQQGNQYKYGFVVVSGSEIVAAPERKEVDVTPKLELPEEPLDLPYETIRRLEY